MDRGFGTKGECSFCFFSDPYIDSGVQVGGFRAWDSEFRAKFGDEGCSA